MSVRLCVVIPTFDRATTLLRAIDSVLSQVTDDVEVVVVDDGSADSTADLLASITDARVRVLTQTNRGVCAARNAGVEATSAEFVTFLDSDDEALPGWIECWLSFAGRNVDLASCAIVRASETDETIEVPRRLGAAFGGLHARMLTGAYCIRRSLFEEVGGFRDDLRYSENTDLALRLGGRMLDEPFKNEVTDKPLVLINPSTRAYDPVVRFESAVTLLKHDRTHLERSPKLLSTYAALAGVAASRTGQRRDALGYLWLAIRTRPTEWKNYARFIRAGVKFR